MLRTVLTGVLVSAAMLSGGGARAQAFDAGVGYGGGGYGGYAPYGYAPYAPYRPHAFTLAGVRAGVTVLGVDVDGSAKLTIGAHGWGHSGGYGYAGGYPAPPPPPVSPPPGYWMGYSAPAHYGIGYAVGCGC